MLRIYRANSGNASSPCKLGPFAKDVQNERWHRIWSTMRWCTVHFWFNDDQNKILAKATLNHKYIPIPYYLVPDESEQQQAEDQAEVQDAVENDGDEGADNDIDDNE